MRKVTVPEKFIRLAIVGALCVNVYGCGVSTGRDLTLAGAVLVLVVVAVTAAWFPARRAAAIEPVEALREH